VRPIALIFSVALAAATASGIARADELRVLSVTEMLSPFQQIIPEFMRSSSASVMIEYVSARAIQQRILNDEKVDLVFVTREGWEPLLKGQKIETPTEIASFGMALGIQSGRLTPDTRDIGSLRKLLVSARNIGLISPAGHAGSARLHEALQHHGLLRDLAPKLKTYSSAFGLAAALARGDVEYGFAPSLSLAEAGVQFVNSLPPEIQNVEKVSAALTVHATSEDAARAFVRALRSAEAQQVLTTTGLEPALLVPDWSAPQSASQKHR
jgi:molybdate transport system substrate-binding protein